IESAIKRGRSVAIVHWRHYEREIRVSLHSSVYDICLRHNVGILGPGDSIAVKVAIVAMPALLHYVIEPRPAIEFDELMVIYEESTQSTESERHLAHLDVVRRNLSEIFGSEGAWLPKAAVIDRVEGMRGRYSGSADFGMQVG